MARIRVERPQGVSGVARSLAAVAEITFIALKLGRVVTWSWWWVLSPLYVGGAALALLVSGLVIVWCLVRWPVILVDLFRREPGR